MKIGDCCITNLEDRSEVRYFGRIKRFTQNMVVVGLTNGAEILRHPHHIAVYVQLPTNWDELYKRQTAQDPSLSPA